jgi:hypothetical protein
MRHVFRTSLLAFLVWVTAAQAGGGTYFHVDDFTGLPAGFGPLAGVQSLWCGARASGSFVSDGYGNAWDETFESCEFGVTTDVTFSYEIRWDLEPDYDYAYAEYEDVTSTWVPLAVSSYLGNRYSGTGSAFETHVIPFALVGPTVRLRFRVATDGGFSDEDGFWDSKGAIVVDNVTVKNGPTTINFEDFECEASFAQVTLSGKWGAGTHSTCAAAVPCHPIRTETTTWGAIKALYR